MVRLSRLLLAARLMGSRTGDPNYLLIPREKSEWAWCVSMPITFQKLILFNRHYSKFGAPWASYLFHGVGLHLERLGGSAMQCNGKSAQRR